MEIFSASDIKKNDNWTCLIYGEAGKGKTTIVKSLEGNTLLLSVDGMYHILANEPNVQIAEMDPKNPAGGIGDFYRYLIKNLDQYDNIVIDNLSTFQKYWLNSKAQETKSGMPEMKDYAILDRVIMDFISSLKALKKNLLLFAHEKNVEITMESGRVYTQFQPDLRNIEALMGIIPVVGRLVLVYDEEKQSEERIIVLQPTQSTKAKDQLIGNIKTINQMALMPTLNNKGEI